MKKKHIAILAAVLCIGILSGCQETPGNTIVKQKGADSVKEYESVEDKIKDMLKAPDTYQNHAEYEKGGLVIDTNAEVILPDADTMNTYKVSAVEVNQELIDKVTNAFFEGAKFYHASGYSQWTKEQYQEDITRLKQYKEEGNMDPYEYGTDENGELYFNIDEQITRDEEDMANAPDEVTKREVKPSFGLEWSSEKGEEGEIQVDEDSFYGFAETDQGNYSYNIISGSLSADVKFSIEKMRDDLPDPRQSTFWVEGRYLMDCERENFKGMTEEELKEYTDISYEDAEKIAREKIEKLGWDWEVYDWDYTVFKRGEGDVEKDNIVDGGYLFCFSRMLDGVPVTFTDSYGGSLEDMDSTLIPWSYERCEVIVGDDGIQKVEIYNPYHIDEVQTENVKLMDFDSIVKIYEQMMEVSNADITKFEAQRTYHINKITLGYSRIYEPVVDNRSGIIVPVWDFFGGIDSEIDGHHEKNNGEHSRQSFMTINAIDGTVIDRGLGY